MVFCQFPLGFQRRDTDGDGAGDGLEVASGTDPLDPASFPALVPALNEFGLILVALSIGRLGRRKATWSAQRGAPTGRARRR